MREIASPLSGPFTTFGQTPIDIYKVGAYRPELAYSFYNEYYRRGRQPVNFLDAITHTRNGNATMVDSDGVLKWAPHNLLIYSEDLASGGGAYGTGVISGNEFTFTVSGDYFRMGSTMSVPSKGKYTGKVTISGGEMGDTFALELVDDADGSDSNTTIVTLDGTTTEWTVEADFSGSSTFSGSLGFYINRSSASRSVTAGSTITVNYMHVYRSDLGGMVDNPDQPASLASYVPTTSSAVYLPRVNHHAYNGSQWVNKGLFVESEARTNLRTYSTPASSNITIINGTLTDDQAVNVAGNLAAPELVEDTTASAYHQLVLTSTAGEASDDVVTFSCFVKRGVGSRNFGIRLRDSDGASSGNNCIARFDLDTGAVYSTVFNGTGNYIDSGISDYGNGWFRCHLTGSISSLVSNYMWNLWIVDEDGTETYTGDGVSSLYIDGLQQEAASTPSSYIPTNGATVTRPAESITIPAANLPWPDPVYVTNTELVTNGTFDTDVASWAVFGDASSTLTWNAGGYADCNAVTYADGLEQTLTGLTAGGVYEITADITFGTATQCGIWAYTSSNNKTFTSDGSKRLVFTASSTSERISVHSSSSTGTFSVDNISVKEINPLALSIQMKGEVTYADEGASSTSVFLRWQLDANNTITHRLDTDSTLTGRPLFYQITNGVADYTSFITPNYSPDINVPFNISSRHGSTFVNGAVDGVALTANTTPVALPDLSATDLQLAYDFMGTISLFRIWADDLGDTGIEEATEPSTEATLFLSFDGTENSYVNFDWSE